MTSFKVRFDDAVHGTFESFDAAADAALADAPDGAQMHIETLEPPRQHWIFDRDGAQWVEQS